MNQPDVRGFASLIAVFSFLAGAPAHAQTYLPPTPYLSRADSPLLLTKPVVEDFEDGVLNILGVSASAGAVFGPDPYCDSVDADDGVIDGSGVNGHSWFEIAGSTGVTFSFDPVALGGYPTSAGVVWTDGGTDVYFEAFDQNGVSFGMTGPFSIGDNSNTGGTAEDHFFGVASRAGISAIHIMNSTGGIECDHVQYSIGALSLESNETAPAASDTLTLTLGGGKNGQTGLLVAIAVNGAPLFLPIFGSTFDGAGTFSLSTTVPSGLTGIVLDVVGLGIAASGKARFSNEVALSFQ